MKHDKALPPETIDEQIEQSLGIPADEALSPETRVMQRLSTLYEADKRSVERVGKRIAQHLAEQSTSSDQPALKLLTPVPESSKASAKRPHSHSASRGGSSRFTLIAAVLCVCVLVGSMLTALHLAYPGQPAQKPASPSGIYLISSNTVYRLDIQTRQIIWQTTVDLVKSGQNIPLFALGSLTVFGDAVYLRENTIFVALDAQTGAIRWSHDFKTYVPIPWVDNGQVYITMHYQLTYIIDTFNPINGKITANLKLSDVADASITPVSTVSIANNVVYSVSPPLDQETLSAIRISDGKKLWQTPLNPKQVFGAFVVQNGVVYVLTGQGQSESDNLIKAYDAASGRQLWQSPLMDSNGIMIAIVNNLIYVSLYNGKLLALDMHTHIFIRQGLDHIINIQAYSNTIYFTYLRNPQSPEVLFGALDAVSGKVLWQKTNGTNGNDYGATIIGVHNGVFYGIGWTSDGKKGVVYALNANTGSTLWTMPVNISNPSLSMLASSLPESSIYSVGFHMGNIVVVD